MIDSFKVIFHENSTLFQYPWHKKQYPIKRDIVVGCIESIGDEVINLKILDYMSVRGYIIINTLSKKKRKEVESLTEGQILPLEVLDEDMNMTIINLNQDKIADLENYGFLINIMIKYCIKTKKDFVTTMTQTFWKCSSIEEANETLKDHTHPIFDFDDSQSLKEIIKELQKSRLEINLVLVTWALNPLILIRSILEKITFIHPNCQLVQLNSPNYKFIIKDSAREEILEINNNFHDIIAKIIGTNDEIRYQVFKVMIDA